jgi:hypothetical protein
MPTLLDRPVVRQRRSPAAASPFSVELSILRTERGPARARSLVRDVLDGMYALPQRHPYYLWLKSPGLGSLLFCANHVAVLEKWQSSENEVFEEMKRMESAMERIASRQTTATLFRVEHRQPLPKRFAQSLVDEFIGLLEKEPAIPRPRESVRPHYKLVSSLVA